MLTSEMVELIDAYSTAVVATVTAEGGAAASVKGTFVVEDDSHIAFGEIRSPGTVANLQANPTVEAVFTDVLTRRAVRVAGTAEIVDTAGDLELEFYVKWARFVPLMNRFVRITVERAEIIVSPSYDIGIGRAELVDSQLQRLDNLAGLERAPETAAVNGFGQPVGLPFDFRQPDPPATKPVSGQYCDVVALDAAAHEVDLFEAFAGADDDSDWTYLPYGPFHEFEPFSAWLHSVANLSDPVFYTIIEQRTGKATGVASYLRVAPPLASIEVGHIHLSRSLQRTAAATEAMYLMMRRAFAQGYRRYEWKCDKLNGPSRVAAKRLGFRFEGTFVQAAHYKGRNRDTAWFSVLDSEWPRLEAEFVRWLDPSNFDANGDQLTRLQATC